MHYKFVFKFIQISSFTYTKFIFVLKILCNRWIASSYRTVCAVWQNYEAMYLFFKEASTSTRWTKAENATFSGLLTRIESPEFLEDLG